MTEACVPTYSSAHRRDLEPRLHIEANMAMEMTRVSVRGTLHVFAILLRNPAGVQARRLRRNRNARTKTKLHQTTYTRGETREPRQSSTRPRIQTSRATRGPRRMPRTPLREGQGSHVEGTGWKELAEIYTASPPHGRRKAVYVFSPW